MPRIPKRPSKIFQPQTTQETVKRLINPLVIYSKCESPAFVRRALNHALEQDLVSVAQGTELIPTSHTISLSRGYTRSNDSISAIEKEQHINSAATVAATSLRNARVLFGQATDATEEVRPILYYYGALSFFEFITKPMAESILKRRSKIQVFFALICQIIFGSWLSEAKREWLLVHQTN